MVVLVVVYPYLDFIILFVLFYFLILKSVEKTSLVQILLLITLDLREGFLANNGVRGYDY